MKRTKIFVNQARFPEPILEFCKDADIYDSSCSHTARVYYVDKGEGLFLKAAPAESLSMEAAMTSYFHSLGLSAEVLTYLTHDGSDYMVTRRIPGEDCTDAVYLADPRRLCQTTAELLRKLHEVDSKKCPVKNRVESYIASVRQGYENRHYDADLFQGLWEFPSFEDAWKEAKEGMGQLCPEVLIHGDYCLPNIILKDWQFSGYIDVGCGGIGDRHIDLLWGIWTLKYNLGTTKWTDYFLDAYGRDKVEEEKLRQIAAMEMIGG